MAVSIIFRIFILLNKRYEYGQIIGNSQSEARAVDAGYFLASGLNRSEDMSDDQKDRFIDYLADRVTVLDLDKRAMELVLEDFLKTQQQMLDKIASLESGQKALQDSLDEETRKRKAAERKAQRLDEQLKYANANRFGDKRQKVKKTLDKTV